MRTTAVIPGPAIVTSNLRKSFGKTVAVANLNLMVREGEIFGLVGPDGAGKTTSFRLMLGLLRPEAGDAMMGGYDSRREVAHVRELVGYVAQAFTLYGDLSVKENMEFNAELRGVPPEDYARRAPELLEMTSLAPFPNRLARDLSGGMKRKLALTCALLHGPRIAILDEPTTGVDPVSRREFWRVLYALPAQGVTLVVSTPYLDEAERCHRLGFMAGGQLLAVDTPAGLLRAMPDGVVEIFTRSPIDVSRLLKERPEVRWVETVDFVRGAMRAAFDPKTPGIDQGRALGHWMTEQGVRILSCEPTPPTLADVFSTLSCQVEATA
jgi:ABC-2 type transport system ATP-binding protein